MAGDANNTGGRVDRGVSGYSEKRGTGTSATPTSTSTVTTKRPPAKVRPNPDQDDGGSSSEDDDPAIAALKEDLMRWEPRGAPASPVYSRPKGTPSDAPKSGTAPPSDSKSTAAAPSQKPAGHRTR